MKSEKMIQFKKCLNDFMKQKRYNSGTYDIRQKFPITLTILRKIEQTLSYTYTKEFLYEILDRCVYLSSHGYYDRDLIMIVSIHHSDFEKIIKHYQLFQDGHKIKPKSHKNDAYIIVLFNNKCSFNIEMDHCMFRNYQSDVLIKIYKHLCKSAESKQLFHKSLLTLNSISSSTSKFIYWYAITINDHTVFEEYLNYMSIAQLKQYIKDTGYKISLKRFYKKSFYNSKEDKIRFIIENCEEKNNFLEVFNGIVNMGIDLKLQKKLLFHLIDEYPQFIDQFMLSLCCQSKFHFTLNILWDCISKKNIKLEWFYLFPLIENFPNYATTLKIISCTIVESSVNKNILIWEQLCYFCFWFNYIKAFNIIYSLHMDKLDKTTMDTLYNGKSKVIVFVKDEQNYEFQVVENTDLLKPYRKHPNKGKMIKCIKLYG